MDSTEQILHGGNVAHTVLRIGDTVRKPATSATTSVEAFLEHLHRAGFLAAPRTLGRDPQGRHVLEYIPGETVSTPLPDEDLRRVGRLIRQLHTAAASFTPPPGAQWNVAIKPDAETLICHHDLAPWNLVRNGSGLFFIDWDGSGPGSPLWDLAYALQSFVPLASGTEPTLAAARLRTFADAYGLNRTQREQLPQKLTDRTWAMCHLLERGAETGEQPWARLHAEGHAIYWSQSAKYVEQHVELWAHALLSGYTDRTKSNAPTG
ncbi:MAG: phosphotransferase [Acidobacteriota bacterium]|nr:phosphotransferase [Acidobacteriota bacterium]